MLIQGFGETQRAAFLRDRARDRPSGEGDPRVAPVQDAKPEFTAKIAAGLIHVEIRENAGFQVVHGLQSGVSQGSRAYPPR